MPKGDSPKSRNGLIPAVKGEVKNPSGINQFSSPNHYEYISTKFRSKARELLSASEFGEALRIKLNLPENADWADAIVERAYREVITRGNVGMLTILLGRTEGAIPQSLNVKRSTESVLRREVQFTVVRRDCPESAEKKRVTITSRDPALIETVDAEAEARALNP